MTEAAPIDPRPAPRRRPGQSRVLAEEAKAVGRPFRDACMAYLTELSSQQRLAPCQVPFGPIPRRAGSQPPRP
jgi:hypothetical protein